jgi:hypothetical protein
VGFKLSLLATRLPTIEEQDEMAEENRAAEGEREASVTDNNDDGKQDQQTFCPPLYHNPIINMMERHYCAHSSIPRFCPPDTKLIKKWAVQYMYNFCLRHKLPEMWVYLWENWY